MVDDTKLNVETKDFLLRCPLAVGTQPLCVEISLQTGEVRWIVFAGNSSLLVFVFRHFWFWGLCARDVCG